MKKVLLYIISCIILIIVLLGILLVFFGSQKDFESNLNVRYHHPIEKTLQYKILNRNQQDLLYYYEVIKETHPIFVDGGIDTVEYKDFVDSLISTLGINNNTDEFYRALLQMDNPLHDAHTVFSINNLWTDTFARKYPVYFKFVENELFVINATLPNKQLIGKKVFRINKNLIDTLINKLEVYLTYENIYGKNKQIETILNKPYLLNKLCVIDNSLDIEIQFEDSALKVFKADTIISYSVSYSNIRKTKYRIDSIGNYCHFNYTSCMYRESYMQMIEIAEISFLDKLSLSIKFMLFIPNFKTMMIDMFNDIRDNNIDNLIIDIRDNGGGNTIYSKVFLEKINYNHDDSIIDESGMYLRTSPLFAKQYPEDYIVYKEGIDSFKMGNIISYETLSKLYKDSIKVPVLLDTYISAPNFDGKVYFIQNRNTFSAGFDLAKKAKQTADFTLIGEPSTQSINIYGDLLIFSLPNSNLLAQCSWKYFYENKDNTSVLEPNVKLTNNIDDIISKKDAYMNWILENISNGNIK